MGFRVASYNIRESIGVQTVPDWHNRCAEILNNISTIGAGILCLQKVSPAEFADLQTHLSASGYKFEYTDHATDGVLVAYQANRFELKDTFSSVSTFDSVSLPASKVVCAHGYLDLFDNTTKKVISVANCHLVENGSQDDFGKMRLDVILKTFYSQPNVDGRILAVDFIPGDRNIWVKTMRNQYKCDGNRSMTIWTNKSFKTPESILLQKPVKLGVSNKTTGHMPTATDFVFASSLKQSYGELLKKERLDKTFDAEMEILSDLISCRHIGYAIGNNIEVLKHCFQSDPNHNDAASRSAAVKRLHSTIEGVFAFSIVKTRVVPLAVEPSRKATQMAQSNPMQAFPEKTAMLPSFGMSELSVTANPSVVKTVGVPSFPPVAPKLKIFFRSSLVDFFRFSIPQFFINIGRFFKFLCRQGLPNY